MADQENENSATTGHLNIGRYLRPSVLAVILSAIFFGLCLLLSEGRANVLAAGDGWFGLLLIGFALLALAVANLGITSLLALSFAETRKAGAVLVLIYVAATVSLYGFVAIQ